MILSIKQILFVVGQLIFLDKIFYYYRNSLLNPEPRQPYSNAVLFMQNAIMESTNINQHHFEPCHPNACGYPLALVNDIGYCKKSDLLKLTHPSIVLDDLYVFRDYGNRDLGRELVRTKMFDVLPSYEQVDQIKQLSILPPTMSVSYPYAKNYFRSHKLGYSAGCLFQKYMHVPGQEELALKSNSSTHQINYLKQLQKQKKPQKCIDDAQFFKTTYRMWDYNECKEIFSIMSSPKYQDHLAKKGIQYIFKTNAHLGNGVLILDYENERTIRKWYQNGTSCGRNYSQVVIQEYISNPYLFKGHKMEFRSYFIIASTNPPILYGYKQALLKQCALGFNLRDFTKQSHVCNTAVTKQHKERTYGGDNDDDLYIDWNLEELQDLLLAQKRITSKTWLQDFLLPQIFRKVTHVYLSVQDLLFKDSRVGELFGVDFLMDDNFRLWIFECNRNPNFLAVTQHRKEKFSRVIPDMIDIQWRLVKSKFKRIQLWVQKNIDFFKKDKKNQDQNRAIILKREFLELHKDKMEPEFDIPSTSLMELIYIGGDKSKQEERSKFIDKECLN